MAGIHFLLSSDGSPYSLAPDLLTATYLCFLLCFLLTEKASLGDRGNFSCLLAIFPYFLFSIIYCRRERCAFRLDGLSYFALESSFILITRFEVLYGLIKVYFRFDYLLHLCALFRWIQILPHSVLGIFLVVVSQLNF